MSAKRFPCGPAIHARVAAGGRNHTSKQSREINAMSAISHLEPELAG